MGDKQHENIEVAAQQKPNEHVSVIQVDTSSENEIKQNSKKLNVVPDTTVNEKLILEDNKSILSLCASKKNISLIERIRESPVALFKSKLSNQYLLAYQFEGNVNNNFSRFEIGYTKDFNDIDNYQFCQTGEEEFKTESGIELGMSLSDLLNKKGEGFLTKTTTDTLIIYQISDLDSSSFLKRYNMPGYFMEFTIKDGTVVKVIYGFDYP